MAFAQALDHCESAYLSQWSAAHSMENALDGGKLPDVAQYRDSQANMFVQSSECAKGLIAAPAPLGVTEDDLHGRGNQSDADRPSSAPSPQTTPTNYEGTASPSDQTLLRKWEELTDECQGGNHSIDDAVCTARDKAGDRLARAGWCHGRPGQTEAERDWHQCRETALNPIPAPQMKWLTACVQDASQAIAKSRYRSTRFKWPVSETDGPNVTFDQPSMQATANSPDVVVSFPLRIDDDAGSSTGASVYCSFRDNYDADGSIKLYNISIH